MRLRNLAPVENVHGKRIISEIANDSHLSLKYRHCRSWQKVQWTGSQESGDQGLESVTYFCMAFRNNFLPWALATESEKKIGPDEWFINCVLEDSGVSGEMTLYLVSFNLLSAL